MASALVKGLGVAFAGGSSAAVGCIALELSPLATAGLVLCASLGSFLYYARVWIQGYYFDKRCHVRADLTGRVAVVTGGTVGGLGFAAAEILHSMGATVVVTVRSQAKGEEVVARLGGGERVSYELIDFLSTASVKKGAAALAKQLGRLDFVVLNAGVGAGKPADMWQANQLGPFVFVEALTPLLVETATRHGDVRVVAVSSGAHKRAAINWDNPWDPSALGKGGLGLGSAYGQSKLAQIMHMRQLQTRLRAKHKALDSETAFRCYAITPGLALTNIQATSVPRALRPLLWLLARSAHVGAHPIKMACVGPRPPLRPHHPHPSPRLHPAAAATAAASPPPPPPDACGRTRARRRPRRAWRLLPEQLLRQAGRRCRRLRQRPEAVGAAVGPVRGQRKGGALPVRSHTAVVFASACRERWTHLMHGDTATGMRVPLSSIQIFWNIARL